MHRWRPGVVVLLAYVGLRLLDLGFFALVARRDRLGLVGVLLSWDGGWYQRALAEGWPDVVARAADGTLEQSTWAWPPLVPLLGRALSLPFGATSGGEVLLALNLVAGAAAALVLYAVLRPYVGERGAVLVSIAWASMPAAPVLLMAYAEGVFILLLFLSMGAAVRERYLLAGALLLLAGLTKSSVLPYAAALALVALAGLRRSAQPRIHPGVVTGTVALAIASVAVWPVTVAVALGGLDAYGQVQAAWGRSTIPGRDTLAAVWGLRVEPRLDIIAGLLVTAVALGVGIAVWRDRRLPVFLRIVGVAGPVFLVATGAALSSARLLLPDPALPAFAGRLMRGPLAVAVVLGVLALLRWGWIALYVSGVSVDPPP